MECDQAKSYRHSWHLDFGDVKYKGKNASFQGYCHQGALHIAPGIMSRNVKLLESTHKPKQSGIMAESALTRSTDVQMLFDAFYDVWLCPIVVLNPDWWPPSHWLCLSSSLWDVDLFVMENERTRE